MKLHMNLIRRDELKAKLDRKDPFKLVMVLSEWAYRSKHIPGSMHIASPEEALAVLERDDDIVVYCSGYDCIASVYAYEYLVRHGYTHVRRYAGGIIDWEESGYPLEGEMVTEGVKS
jgi:rhodanese-related sulfurtransferase